MDANEYRQLMSHHAGATVIVATGTPGERTGLTATATCSLSDSPPMLLVCVNKSASAHPVIRRTRAFSINLLAQGQDELAACFSGRTGLKGEARFQAGEWLTLATGAPVLAQALASADCELATEHDCGTHSIFIGLVRASRADASLRPLVYFRGAFGALHGDAEALGRGAAQASSSASSARSDTVESA
jgi:flavin reductase (DIM6/NTAB) family NADH-FMN oxidoreductase RutF